ncbi:MAG: hypothetical protein U0232_27420 [Thermomicrobiales bacterium]
MHHDRNEGQPDRQVTHCGAIGAAPGLSRWGTAPAANMVADAPGGCASRDPARRENSCHWCSFTGRRWLAVSWNSWKWLLVVER